MKSTSILEKFNVKPRENASCVCYRALSHNAETKDFARPTSHPVRGWTGKNKAFCSPGTQNGRRVTKVYCVFNLRETCVLSEICITSSSIISREVSL